MRIVGDITLPRLSVLGSSMAYREIGGPEETPTVLFLHGNPTSSYIWRDVMPHVAPVAHCLAPDLIGFGQSDKPDIEYRFFDQARYLDAFVENSGISSAYIVAQDWGTALAFYLAARRPNFVRGLAFMEFVRPFADWEAFTPHVDVQAVFKGLREPEQGERLIFDENVFIDQLLPSAVVRTMSLTEMNVYRAPFVRREARKPMLQFPRDIPIAGHPADMDEAMRLAQESLTASRYPKLLFSGNPGGVVTPEYAEHFSASLANCTHIPLPSGVHFLQEDHPDIIGREVAKWVLRSSDI